MPSNDVIYVQDGMQSAVAGRHISRSVKYQRQQRFITIARQSDASESGAAETISKPVVKLAFLFSAVYYRPYFMLTCNTCYIQRVKFARPFVACNDFISKEGILIACNILTLLKLIVHVQF